MPTAIVLSFSSDRSKDKSAFLPPAPVHVVCECGELCNCPPTMTRSQAMAYCEIRLQQSAIGSADHAMYNRLLKKAQLIQASDAFALAQVAFRETSRGEYV